MSRVSPARFFIFRDLIHGSEDGMVVDDFSGKRRCDGGVLSKGSVQPISQGRSSASNGVNEAQRTNNLWQQAGLCFDTD